MTTAPPPPPPQPSPPAPNPHRDPDGPDEWVDDDDRARRRGKHIIEGSVIGVLLLLVCLASVTVLGKNASSKFSSVASAICDVRGSTRRSPLLDPHAGVVIAAPLAATITGGGDENAAAGGCGAPAQAISGGPSTGSSGGANNNTASAPATTPGGSPPANNQTASFAVNALDPAVNGAAAAGHSFVSTATMTVKVDAKIDPNQPAPDAAAAKRMANKAVGDAKNQAVQAVAAVGGGLFGEESSFEGSATSTVTLKVPAVSFIDVKNKLTELGELQTSQVKTDEVTGQVIDLDARITASSNGLDRSRGLLAKATNLSDIATLEADVSRRETELETLKGQQAALAQQIELSTIVLTLTSTVPDAAVPPGTGPTTTTPSAAAAPAPLPGFFDGLNGGWKVFTNVGTVLLAAFGATLPFLPLLIIVVVVWRVVRRRSLRSAAGARPAGSATA